jgi:hypothetical protein
MEKIHISKDGNKIGIFTLDEINRMLVSGEISPEDMAWHEDMEDWEEIKNLNGIKIPGNGSDSNQNTVGQKSGQLRHLLTLFGSMLKKFFLLVEGIVTIVSRRVSIIVAFLVLIGMLYVITTLVTSWIKSSYVEVPKYSENASSDTDAVPQDDDALTLKRKIESEYGKDIEIIVRKHDLGDSTYDGLKNFLQRLPEKHWDRFLTGLSDYLESAEKDKKPNRQEKLDLVNDYGNKFWTSVQKTENYKEELADDFGMEFLKILGCFITLCLIAILISVIRVELNTRSSKIS